jgi:Cu-Zn family superoxide dismutase
MRLPGAVCALAVAASAVVLGGCESSKDATAPRFGPGSGLDAPLQALGASAVNGRVSFAQRDNGVVLSLTIYGLRVGRYRVVIHTTGNCSSPNGFSAGPPYSPPGVTPPLETQVPPFWIYDGNSSEVSMRLTGVSLDGPNSILGRSVIVHEGAEGSLETVPNVRNGRVACGVIGPVKTMF